MSDTPESREADVIPEQDFSRGARGKYAAAYRERTNLVAIEPDLLKIFPDAEAVNRALRSVAKNFSPPGE